MRCGCGGLFLFGLEKPIEVRRREELGELRPDEVR